MQQFDAAVEELRNFIVTEKLKLNIEVGENEVAIMHETPIGGRLKITCVGQGIYRLKDAQDGGFQRQVHTAQAWWAGDEGPFAQSDMIASAKRWMNNQFGR
jgi:hypothetical protein